MDDIYSFPSGKKWCSSCRSNSCEHTHTPSFPVEKSKPKKVGFKKVHERSRVNHEQSARGSRRDGVTRGGSVYERFHNYGVKFDAVVLWDYIFVDPSNLNNGVQFKRLDFPLAIVKVFRKSILVTLRASKDIKGMMVKDAEKLCISRVNEVLDGLPKSVQIANRVVVNTHNAFVNHPIAERSELPLRVEINGELRAISDKSKGRNEFEYVNAEHAVNDSVLQESDDAGYTKEMLERDTKELLSTQLTREVIGKFMVDLVNDRAYWAKHQISHVAAIQELSKGVKAFTSEVKKDRIRKIKEDWW